MASHIVSAMTRLFKFPGLVIRTFSTVATGPGLYVGDGSVRGFFKVNHQTFIIRAMAT